MNHETSSEGCSAADRRMSTPEQMPSKPGFFMADGEENNKVGKSSHTTCFLLIQAFEVNVQLITLFKRVTFLESRANCFSEVWISFGTTTHETHLIDMPGQLEYKQVEHNWAPTLLITILKFLFADTWQAFQHVTHFFHPISSSLYSTKTVFLSF